MADDPDTSSPFGSKMLVGYSSSSSSEEEDDAAAGADVEEDADDGCSARKKLKTEDQVPKNRCIHFCRALYIEYIYKSNLFKGI